MMKMMMVCHFVSDSHKVMTPLTLICNLQFVVVEISQQCHRYAVNLSFQIKCTLNCLEKNFIFEKLEE